MTRTSAEEGDQPSVPPELGRLEKRSLTSRARELLLDSIRRGVFPEGRLPNESALAARLGVSRATLRSALRSLEDQGVIQRQPGVGTLVNHHVMRSTISLNRVVGFSHLIRESGYRAEIAWTRKIEGIADADVAIRLECAVGESLVCFERLLLADGRPAIYLVEQIPSSVLVHEVDPGKVPDSIFDFMAVYGAEAVDHTILELGCRTANETLSETLELPIGTPVLHLEESHYGAGGRALMFSRIDVVDSMVRLGVVRTRG